MRWLKLEDLRRIFTELDKNGDEMVSMEELSRLLQTIEFHCTTKQLESLVGKSSLDFAEFVLFWDSIWTDENDDDLVCAFKTFDLNGDGFISADELEKVLLRMDLWDENDDCQVMISVFDSNFDGVLDFHEFKRMMMLPFPNQSS